MTLPLICFITGAMLGCSFGVVVMCLCRVEA
jgi:hypothetical protein